MQETLNKVNKQSRHNSSDVEEFVVTYTPIKAGQYHIYLFGDIACASQFISAIEVLNSATENDVVIIHLSTNGGSLSATDTFLQAMMECEGHVVCKATGDVHSAGTLILLAADEFSLSENFSSLIHNGSTGTGGKFSDYKSESLHTIKYMERVMRNGYSGFLSELEIEDMLRGIDIWLDAESFAQRYAQRNEYFKAKQEEFEAEQQKLLCPPFEGNPEDCALPKKAAKKPLKLPKKQLAEA